MQWNLPFAFTQSEIDGNTTPLPQLSSPRVYEDFLNPFPPSTPAIEQFRRDTPRQESPFLPLDNMHTPLADEYFEDKEKMRDRDVTPPLQMALNDDSDEEAPLSKVVSPVAFGAGDFGLGERDGSPPPLPG